LSFGFLFSASDSEKLRHSDAVFSVGGVHGLWAGLSASQVAFGPPFSFKGSGTMTAPLSCETYPPLSFSTD
jgi:hypothetical protein